MINDLNESISKLKKLEVKLVDDKDKLYLRQSIANIDSVMYSLKQEYENHDCLCGFCNDYHPESYTCEAEADYYAQLDLKNECDLNGLEATLGQAE